MLIVVDRLLRNRAEFLHAIEITDDAVPIARSLMLTIIASTSLFGAVLGAHHLGTASSSWLQVLFAGVKLPVVVLLTAALTAPALYSLGVGIQGRASVRQDALLVLASLALGAMVLAALAPVVLFMSLAAASYHARVVVSVVCCAIAGGFGLLLFAQGVRRRPHRGSGFVIAITLAVVTLVGSQMAWTFRPYLVRPRATSVPFIRPIEGSLMDSFSRSTDSARGVYTRDAAPLPSE